MIRVLNCERQCDTAPVAVTGGYWFVNLIKDKRGLATFTVFALATVMRDKTAASGKTIPNRQRDNLLIRFRLLPPGVVNTSLGTDGQTESISHQLGGDPQSALYELNEQQELAPRLPTVRAA